MRQKCVVMAGLVAIVQVGCQSYAPKPLDLQGHDEAWRARRADDATVQAYIASLYDREVIEHTPWESPFNPSAGMTIEDAELVALIYNPELRLARSDQRIAGAIAEHAGLMDDPALSLDVMHILESVGGGPWIIGGALSFTLPISGRLESEKLLALAKENVALLEVLEREREIVRRLRLAWLEWSVLDQRIHLIDDMLADVKPLAAKALQMSEIGEMLRTEASLFGIEQTSREIEREVLYEQQRAAEEEIRSIIGLPPEASIDIISQPSFLSADLEEVFSDPAVLEQRSPELARLRAAHTAAEERLHLEIRRQYPDLAIGPAYESESSQSRIGFIAGIPLPIFNANRQGIAEAEAARERAAAAFETAYERIVGRAQILKRLLSAARLEQERISNRLAPLIDAQVREARELLDIGEHSPLAMLEGIIRRHEAKLRALDALANEAEAAIELRSLVVDEQRRARVEAIQ